MFFDVNRCRQLLVPYKTVIHDVNETDPKMDGLLPERLNLTINRWTSNWTIWLINNGRIETGQWMINKLYKSLSANTTVAKLTTRFQWTRLITLSTDKHCSLDSEDNFCSGCWNISHQQPFFSELPSPGLSHSLIITTVINVDRISSPLLWLWLTPIYALL